MRVPKLRHVRGWLVNVMYGVSSLLSGVCVVATLPCIAPGVVLAASSIPAAVAHLEWWRAAALTVADTAAAFGVIATAVYYIATVAHRLRGGQPWHVTGLQGVEEMLTRPRVWLPRLLLGHGPGNMVLLKAITILLAWGCLMLTDLLRIGAAYTSGLIPLGSLMEAAFRSRETCPHSRCVAEQLHRKAATFLDRASWWLELTRPLHGIFDAIAPVACPSHTGNAAAARPLWGTAVLCVMAAGFTTLLAVSASHCLGIVMLRRRVTRFRERRGELLSLVPRGAKGQCVLDHPAALALRAEEGVAVPLCLALHPGRAIVPMFRDGPCARRLLGSEVVLCIGAAEDAVRVARHGPSLIRPEDGACLVAHGIDAFDTDSKNDDKMLRDMMHNNIEATMFVNWVYAALYDELPRAPWRFIANSDGPCPRQQRRVWCSARATCRASCSHPAARRKRLCSTVRWTSRRSGCRRWGTTRALDRGSPSRSAPTRSGPRFAAQAIVTPNSFRSRPSWSAPRGTPSRCIMTGNSSPRPRTEQCWTSTAAYARPGAYCGY